MSQVNKTCNKIKKQCNNALLKTIAQSAKGNEMAKNIIAQVHGGRRVDLNEVFTVQDVYNALNLTGSKTVTINGEPADMDDELADYNQVFFADAVKGGRN